MAVSAKKKEQTSDGGCVCVVVWCLLVCFSVVGLQEGENINQLAVWEKSVPSRGNQSTRS